jgi:hypothetical protein
MPIQTTGSLVDVLQLSTISPKKPLRSERKQRRTLHRWTSEELNLISYLRLHRNWSWVQIQRTFFSSKSAAAIRLPYTHIPTEDRMHHASAALSLTANSTNIRKISLSIPSISSSVQNGNDIELVALTAPSTQDECTVSANNNTTRRYNLRPNRPRSFKKRGSPCQVDRSRFPHFCQAYETHWKQLTAPDTDYSPPPQSPISESSIRSLSVPLSLPSDVSSLELFGLEVRPVNSLDSGLPIVPNSPCDGSLSVEEYPASS